VEVLHRRAPGGKPVTEICKNGLSFVPLPKRKEAEKTTSSGEKSGGEPFR
jgi:hypothetical protein